ncbi:MAG: hypothetical protein AAGI01_07340 [Myxococcota bacterium]
MTPIRISIVSALAILLVSCGQSQDNPPFAPCEIAVRAPTLSDHTIRQAGLEALAAKRFWEHGPYYTFTTTPDHACRNNPTTSGATRVPGVQLFVTYPTATAPQRTGIAAPARGPFPVVVFSHANNDTQCSIFEDYRTLHRHWASWGFIVVSVDDTATNCQRGTKQNILDRSDRQISAIQAIGDFSEDPEHIFFGRVDTSKLVLVGHSRGGGASMVTFTKMPAALKGLILLQSVDSTGFGFGTPSFDIPTLGISASEDVDLNYPYVEPTEEQLVGAYSWVTIYGGIHAWTADTVPIEPDDVPLITQEEQHDVQEYYTTAFLAHVVGVGDGSPSPEVSPQDQSDLLFSHDGAHIVDQYISDTGVAVRWNDRAPNTTLIEDFNDGALGSNATGGSNFTVNLSRDAEVSPWVPDEPPGAIYGKASARLLVPEQGETGALRMELGQPLSVAPGASFQARIKGPDSGAMPSVDVVFTWAAGSSWRVDALQYIGPEALTNRYVQVVIPFHERGEAQGKTLESVTIEVEGAALFVDDPRVVE